MFIPTHWLIAGRLLKAIEPQQRRQLDSLAFKIGAVMPDIFPGLAGTAHDKRDLKKVFRIMPPSLKRLWLSRLSKKAVASAWLGIISHYVCDCFCRAHNSQEYDRWLDHCVYEYRLDRQSRTSKWTVDGQAEGILAGEDLDRVLARVAQHIDEEHRDYLSAPVSIDNDLHYSFNLSLGTVTALLATLYSHDNGVTVADIQGLPA